MSGCRDLSELTIDRYQLMERLGQGGYGAVYAARSLKSNHSLKVRFPTIRETWLKNMPSRTTFKP